jgi:serine/threonine-protein kinase
MIGTRINQYLIQEKIGSGGQGTVYKALDTKLNRAAVIKILSPELTAKTANFKRFEREAQLCSQLDHPNICTIYDFHEANGIYYIAMQFVEGKNVRQLVAGRPLETKAALSIAIQVCDALAYTHSRGIIHRDIKAGNVMVSDSGQAKILDFGLAKLVENTTSVEHDGHMSDITEIGVPYGTATYAAPEQAKGERADHRADIFSTGVLLYEMLTGIWAFQGKTVVDVRHQVLHGTPTPVAEMRAEYTPPRLQQIIDRALAKEPSNRYQKISEMRDDLRAVLQEVSGGSFMHGDTFAPRHAGTSVIKKALSWFTGKTEESSAQGPSFGNLSSSPDLTHTMTGGDKKSIAILPFKNLAQDAAADFYEFALADAVITELAQLKSLIVRPSSVITKYQGVETDPRQAGSELKVNAVLTAGFIRSGDRLRVTAQLVDVATGEMLWSDRIDAEGHDILALQDTIGQRILEGLRVELSEKEQQKLGRRPTESTEAWDEYLRGRDNFGRFIFKTISNEDCEAAMANFRKAIDLDPEFALAYSALGACHANRVLKGIGDAADYERAEELFAKAVELDPNVVESRVLMVMIHMAHGDKRKARTEIEQLERQYPNEAPLYFVKGIINRLDGNYEASLKAWQKLARLDPAAVVISSYNRARIFIYRGQYDEAFEEIEKGCKTEPNHPMLQIFKSSVQYFSGDPKGAIETIEKVIAEHPEMEGVHALYAIYLAGSGRKEAALAQLTDETLELARTDHDMSYWVGSAYALLEDKDKAFKWLERAVKLGNENEPWFKSDRNLESLREDPRFLDLLDKMVESY